MQVSKDIAAVARFLRRRRNVYLAPVGLKSVHARYLREICDHAGISQDGLAQLLDYDKSNVARQVAMLEENGFIRREPCKADKRLLLLYPTEKTLEMMPALRQSMEQWESGLLKVLTPQERAQFAALLARVREAADTEG